MNKTTQIRAIVEAAFPKGIRYLYNDKRKNGRRLKFIPDSGLSLIEQASVERNIRLQLSQIPNIKEAHWATNNSPQKWCHGYSYFHVVYST